MEGGAKHPPPVLHQPKKPGANRVKMGVVATLPELSEWTLTCSCFFQELYSHIDKNSGENVSGYVSHQNSKQGNFLQNQLKFGTLMIQHEKKTKT